MNSKDLQKLVNKTFRENFGYTSLTERLEDIQREFFELMRWQDIPNLKEETGDLLGSLIQMCNENDWDLEELIKLNSEKIYNRSLQYKSLGRKTKVAILGGAFNPITSGHIQSAQFILNTSKQFDEVWLMPAYNHMYNKKMVSSKDRIKMCELASKTDGRIKVFDFEIYHKLSGETYYFFKKLKESKLIEQYDFSMVIGLDNANTFDKWVNYDKLERMAKFVVIPRKGYNINPDVNWYLNPPHIFLNNETNIIEISSTDVRNILKKYYDDKSDKHLYELSKYLNNDVIEYIIQNNLYNE